jgi:hypothetical protein
MSDRIYKFYIQMARRFIVPLAMVASMASILGLLFFFYKDIAYRETNLFPILAGVLASLIGVTVSVGMAWAWLQVRSRRTVFVSYTHQDTEFVMKLAEDLKRMNLEPLIDRLELKVGDNIRQAVDEMIDKSDYFLFVISESSMKSDWAKKELEQAVSRKKKVLPVVLHTPSVPKEISGVFYANFSEGYETGIDQLQKTFRAR